jgi:hypothetical protein
MKLKRNIATSESGFVFNPTNGDSFSSNPIGTEILFLLKEGKSFLEVKKEILQKYDVDQSIFEKDFDDFIMALRTYNLLDYEG